jgi:hypothetical protein
VQMYARDIRALEGRSLSINGAGYLQMWMNGTVHLVHRWIMHPIPEGMMVDHIDRDPRNNMRSNLRVVTPSVNTLNTDRYANSPLGVGVRKYRGRYTARVQRNGKEVHLGTFDTPEEARAARSAYLES